MFKPKPNPKPNPNKPKDDDTLHRAINNLIEDDIVHVDELPPVWQKLPRRRMKTQEERVIDEILRREGKNYTFARLKEILHPDIVRILRDKGYQVEQSKNPGSETKGYTIINWKNTIQVETPNN